jgi:hypothetical protein
MLSIGLIGEIKFLVPYIQRIQKNPEIHVVGKSSIGTKMFMDDLYYPIPEFNRIELIERCDILLVNHFSILPYNLIRNAIKKSTHIFAADYPPFSNEECEELIKLSGEAQAVFQVKNPLFHEPSVRWLNDNIKAPAFLDISFFKEDYQVTDRLTDILLMLNIITDTSPKKIDAISFQSPRVKAEFNNLRLDYGNAEIVNLNFGKQHTDEFIIKAYSKGKTTFLNFKNQTFICNNSPIELTQYSSNEFDIFIDNIMNKKQPVTGIDNYLSVLRTINHINTKLAQFYIT